MKHPVKIIIRIPNILLLLLLVIILSVQSVFSNFVICFGEDGHVDIDISITGNQYATIHHMTEHGERSTYSVNCIFLSEKDIEDCHDIIILLSSQFVDLKVKNELGLNTVINPLFTALNSHCFDIVENNTIKYFAQTSIPPDMPSYSSFNSPLLI